MIETSTTDKFNRAKDRLERPLFVVEKFVQKGKDIGAGAAHLCKSLFVSYD